MWSDQRQPRAEVVGDAARRGVATPGHEHDAHAAARGRASIASRVRGESVRSLRSSVPSMSSATSRTPRRARAAHSPGPDRDPLDHVARPDPVDDVHAGHHLAEERVAPVEVRLRRERDEELAAAGVLARERHAHGAAAVGAARDLAAQRVAGAAVAVAARAAALHDEAGLDAVEAQAVVEAAPGERHEGRAW